ncbi:hypothetical protein D3C72_2138890 [compost metagenome]
MAGVDGFTVLLLMATSRLRPDEAMLPLVNDCTTAFTRVPRPIFEPAYTSANCAVDCLKPTVLALAMLLPITSRLDAAAFRPLTP